LPMARTLKAPRHRGCGSSPAVCPDLRAGHPADGAIVGPSELARSSLRRSSADPLGGSFKMENRCAQQRDEQSSWLSSRTRGYLERVHISAARRGGKCIPEVARRKSHWLLRWTQVKGVALPWSASLAFHIDGSPTNRCSRPGLRPGVVSVAVSGSRCCIE